MNAIHGIPGTEWFGKKALDRFTEASFMFHIAAKTLLTQPAKITSFITNTTISIPGGTFRKLREVLRDAMSVRC
jgi:hypothetical protein